VYTSGGALAPRRSLLPRIWGAALRNRTPYLPPFRQHSLERQPAATTYGPEVCPTICGQNERCRLARLGTGGADPPFKGQEQPDVTAVPDPTLPVTRPPPNDPSPPYAAVQASPREGRFKPHLRPTIAGKVFGSFAPKAVTAATIDPRTSNPPGLSSIDN